MNIQLKLALAVVTFFSFIVVPTFCASTTTEAPLNVVKICQKLTTNEMSVTLRLDAGAGYNMYAYNPTSANGPLYSTTCKGVLDVATNQYVISYTYDVANMYQLVPSASVMDCLPQMSGTDLQFWLYLEIYDNVHTSQHAVSGSCDTTIPVQQIQSAQLPITDVDAIPTVTPLPAALPAVTCIVSDATGTLIPTVAFGSPFYIACSLTTSASSSIYGIHISSMVVSNNPQNRGLTVQLVDGNGCLLRGNKYVDAFAGSTYNTWALTVNGTAYDNTLVYDAEADTDFLMLSGPFEASIITPGQGNSGPRLYVTFTYGYDCTSYYADKCTNQEEYCKFKGWYHAPSSASVSVPVNGKKKRSIDDDISKTNYIMVVPVNIKQGGHFVGGTDELNQTPENTTPEAPQSFYWILAAILGVLLLLVVMVCVFLVIRMRRERVFKEQSYEGQKNPAYH